MQQTMFTKKNPLGNTGMMVSRVGLGTWGIGGKAYGELGANEAERCVESYLERGGNFIDTARMYDDSEEVVGRVIKRMGNREDIILCTKSMSGGSKEEMPGFREDIEKSLRVLGTDYIDVYFLHNPPVEIEDIHRMLDILAEYKEKGIIRAIGASIKGVNVNDQTVELCHTYLDTGMMNVLMLCYSIFRQKMEPIFDLCQEKGVGVVTRSLLESGFLTGAFEKGHTFSATDHRNRWAREALDEMFEEAKKLQELVVEAPYENLAQVAIQFGLSAPGVSTGIVGATTESDVDRNTVLDALPPLSEATIKMLKERFAGCSERYNAGVWNYGEHKQTGMK